MNSNIKYLAALPVAGLIAGLAACGSAHTTTKIPLHHTTTPVHSAPAVRSSPPSPTVTHVKTAPKPATTPNRPTSAGVNITYPGGKGPGGTVLPKTSGKSGEVVPDTAPVRTPTRAASASYSCTEVSDLGGKTTLHQQSYPVYYQGTAYCDSGSVAVVQRTESMASEQQKTANGGPVYCTYLRMGEAYCSDGTYASDPSEQNFTK